MDKERKKQLKKLGKAEVERRSQELKDQLKAANPAELSDADAWMANYKTGTRREQWLRKKLPTLHKKRLEELFVVHPCNSSGWLPDEGNYLQCEGCGSAVPSVSRARLIKYTGCRCRNIIYWRFFRWHCWRIRRRERVIPVKLIGRG